jgi:hypothetical protein
MADPKIGMNEISGIVRHKETKKPLPNILVVAYDLDPDGVNPDRDEILVKTDPQSRLNDPKTYLKSGRDKFTNGIPGDRLGSVMTDESGSFVIHYADDAFRIREQQRRVGRDDVGPVDTYKDVRPDLFITVLSPEEVGQEEFDNVLFRSNWARINAGRLETYVIDISSAELKRARLPIPQEGDSKDDIDSEFLRYKNNVTGERDFSKKVATFNNELDLEDKPERDNVTKAIRRAAVRDISDFGSENSLIRFVQSNEEIDTAQQSVYKLGATAIDATIAPAPQQPGRGIKISLYLTDEEKDAIDDADFTVDQTKYFTINEADIEQVLLKSEDDDGINAILFSENPISKYCIQKTASTACAESAFEEAAAAAAGQGDIEPATDDGATDATDIPKLVKKVLFDKSLNVFDENKDLSERPDADSVQTNVDSFALQKGPADATAFYDFNQLQIAFSHVWQQLVDETLVDLGNKAHFGLKTIGRKSIFPKIAGNTVFTMANLKLSIQGALADKDAIPPTIVKNFDIHVLEYEALSNKQRSELGTIANEINELKKLDTIKVPQFWGPARTVSVDHSDKIEILYDQGEMILENIRINKPNSTQSILKDLHDRLLEKYEFTVFAADKKYHSVNFGLVNTYRQKWEPVSYQAGQLAKTIPMAPKEERKYSVKVKRNTKTTERQAEKYNSVVGSESALTSRAESEIVAKAQKKTDFDFNVKVSYPKVSSKLGVGKDASKDSSEAKKSFRESVLNAAQEFRDEWSLTIDSEESISSEVSESGTIVNPNDELSVTYLFYQLQRRYRVSEQLYRTTPVVLVALDVPAPHEITEGWVVAHDWIINRALLDDSFRESLEIVATKTVGDQFAIRELRKSMREQRRLVRTLEREFAKLEQDVDNKYRTVRDSVDDRIDEEHDKRFFKRRLIGWFFGSGERPEAPDPEMAKALEQAAADDHAYAVEQAKNLSMSLQRETRNLHGIVREYNEVMEQHLERRLAVKRLTTHIKENILHYMQAIWSMEPPDQRFMRLHKVKVPTFNVTRTCIVADADVDDLFSQFRTDGKKKYEAWLHGTIEKNNNGQPDVDYKALVEVAELDTVLGFKGNYIMFPLKKHNGLTKLMAAPYVDEAFGAMDPDQISNVTLDEYSKYICCLKKEDPDEFERLKVPLKAFLSQILSDPLRNGDEVIVPTDSLFIEMLPSDKSLLEDFKLKHRQMDVMEARAGVRKRELENVRLAARLLEGERDDPDIDKKVVVTGAASVVVDD